MAKLQIFVFAFLLAQAYSSVPQTRPVAVPEETPICVQYVKLLLQSIIDKLSDIPTTTRPNPLPEPQDPEVDQPDIEQPENQDPEVVVPEPEVAEAPCTACFEYLTTLISRAQKAASS